MKYRPLVLFAVSMIALASCHPSMIESSGPCAGGVFIGSEQDLKNSGLIKYGDYVSPPLAPIGFNLLGVSFWFQNEVTFVPIYDRGDWLQSINIPGKLQVGSRTFTLPRIANDIELCVDSTTNDFYSRR